VQVEAFAVRLRPRTPLEAADLGVRLCQSTARPVYCCYWLVALPVVALALASFELAPWLPSLVIWWAKPWFDRTILFVLSRAAFGQQTATADVWRAWRQIWLSQFLLTWTVQRLSLWRLITQPVYQLEGLSMWTRGGRIRQIRSRNVGTALMTTNAFSLSELALTTAVFSLVFWLAPPGRTDSLVEILSGHVSGFLALSLPIAYAMAVLFLEPFYVGAGFALYLNRRAELEAWDIEQEFRRAFTH